MSSLAEATPLISYSEREEVIRSDVRGDILVGEVAVVCLKAANRREFRRVILTAHRKDEIHQGVQSGYRRASTS